MWYLHYKTWEKTHLHEQTALSAKVTIRKNNHGFKQESDKLMTQIHNEQRNPYIVFPVSRWGDIL